MDLEFNAKLEAIMKRHRTDKWNDDCNNDAEYHAILNGHQIAVEAAPSANWWDIRASLKIECIDGKLKYPF